MFIDATLVSECGKLTFNASSAYEAMQKLVVTLKNKHRGESVTIRQSDSGRHLYVNQSGDTYVIAV